ncbi:MAG: hypothetical protein HYV07_06535 [Deltaproteobacteria bacterium]|nr:hypothetical protein [Deltaproteobacteria bacterium]
MGRRSREKRERQEAERRERDRAAADTHRAAQLIDELRKLPPRLEVQAADFDPARVTCDRAALEAKRLRGSSRLTEALELAEAGARRTPELCAEEALAAFALGRDDQAEAAAATVPSVKAFFAPLLAALRGKPVRAPRNAPKAARAATAWAKTLVALKKGDMKGAERGRRQCSKLGLSDLVDPLMGLALASESCPPGLLDRVPSTSWKLVPAAIAALAAAAIGRRFHNELVTRRLRFPAEDIFAPALLAAAASIPAGPDQRNQLTRLFAEIDVDRLPQAQRATGKLYQAFGLIESEVAASAFESAISLGADLGECLRGLSVTHHINHEPELAAKTLLRLARHLASQKGSAELAITVGIHAARELIMVGDERHLEARRLTEEVATRAELLEGNVGRQLKILDAGATLRSNRAAGLRLIDEVLAEDPSSVDAWRLKVSASRADPETAVAVLEQAYAATRDPGFRADGDREEKRLLNTPGRVAAALAQVLGEVDAIKKLVVPPHIEAARAKLDPPGREAVDAAMVALFGAQGSAAGEELARQRFRANDPTWRVIAGVAFRTHPSLATELLASWPQGRASGFATLFELAVHAGARDAAAKLLDLCAAMLPAQAIKAHKETLIRMGTQTLAGEFERVRLRLHPEFSLLNAASHSMASGVVFEFEDEFEDEFDDELDDELDGLGPELRQAGRMAASLPEEAIRQIMKTMPRDIRSFIDTMGRLTGTKPEQLVRTLLAGQLPTKDARLMKMINEIMGKRR